MSSVVIAGDVSGSVTLQAPSVAGSTTLTLPSTSATIATNVNGDLYPLVSGTAVASTSGTSITFTGIPSWVKRITVMFNGVSTNGTSVMQVQLGAGSVTTSGYLSGASIIAGTSVNSASYTAGFGTYSNAAADTRTGHLIITNISSNVWVASGVLNIAGSNNTIQFAGNITLPSTLDRIRITTVNGTDTFDAGSINILYE